MSVGVLARDQSGATARGADPIDPRLRARRDEVTRHRRGRRVRRLLVVLVVLAVALGAAGVTRSSLLDVDHVFVRGEVRTSAAAIRRASGIGRGNAMIWIDTGAAARRIEGLPWVRSAAVVRTWPGTIKITVLERQPVAIAGSGRGAALVDAQGYVLGPDHPLAALPTIASAPGEPGTRLGPGARSLVAIVAALPDHLRGQVRSVRSTSGGAELTLADGIVVRWGDGSEPEAKAGAVAALLRQADRPTIATIDVTVPTAVALTRLITPRH